MWIELLSYVGTPIVTALAMWWLLRGGTDDVPVEDGALVLRYPRSFAWFGVVILAVGVGITALVFLSVDPDPLDLLAICVVMAIPGLAFVAIQRRERLRVTLEGLEARGALGRVRQLPWAEVESVTFENLMSSLTFHGADGTKLRASVFYVGIVALADVVERRLGGRGGAGAVRQLREYRQGMGVAPKR